MLTNIYSEFLTIATLHLFAVMSPGPDFALIVRQSLCHGRKTSIITSIGIGVGILFHILYCIIGLGFIISKNIYLFNLIKFSGAIYLLFIGYKSILSKPTQSTHKKIISKSNSFFMGLITNILNPKATLFFLSLYAFIINEQPSISIQAFYGIWMAVTTILWFCFLSIILTNNIIADKINNFANIAQRGAGLMLILIGLRILFFQ